MAHANKTSNDTFDDRQDLQDVSQLSSDIHATDPGPDVADEPVDPNQVAAGDDPRDRPAPTAAQLDKVVVGGRNWLQNRWDWYRIHRRWTISLTILVLIGIVMGVPQSRYAVLGLVLTKDYQVAVVDARTGTPVSAAVVTAGDTRAVTDNKGRATINSKVGNRQFTVIKKYYRNATMTLMVPISQQGSPQRLSVTATGRPVPVVVTNRLTGKPLANAVVAASGTEARTDKDGKAILVLPADRQRVAASVKAGNYNTIQARVTVTGQAVQLNSFALTPSGKVYFLSKQSGKIDVVKTNLDGSGRQVVLAGTGNEDNFDTILLPSSDWQYLALKSTRDGGELAKLFLIDTATDKLSVIDEGNASYMQVGWSGEQLVYRVHRNNYTSWQPGAVSLKSFNARTARIAVLDSTSATGNADYNAQYEVLPAAYILGDEVVYSKLWYSYPGYINVAGQQNTLASVALDGTKKTTIAKYDSNDAYFDSLQVGEPNQLIARVISATAGADRFYAYAKGKLTPRTDIKIEAFGRQHSAYFTSPGGKTVLWSEPRDGKNVLLTRDSNAGAAKQLASFGEYTAYGWYGDDYVLLSRNASEQYIMPATGGSLVKVTDYHVAGAIPGYGGH